MKIQWVGTGGSAAERAGCSRTWPRLSSALLLLHRGCAAHRRDFRAGDLSLALDSESGFSSAGPLRGAQSSAEAVRPRDAPRGASARGGIQWDAQLALGRVVGWLLEPAVRLRDGHTLGSLMLLLVIHRKNKPQFILFKSPPSASHLVVPLPWEGLSRSVLSSSERVSCAWNTLQ